ncbi:hypothetical protein [Streptomyces sp. BRA346]|uniref:hypothetical protein n=1 Tax=Streptomyces sp. BRA346 TaxID=2878199 RepID=UPI0040631DB7
MEKKTPKRNLARIERATLALLADLPAWRIRAVERVELSSALWSERERDIHVIPLNEVAREVPDLYRALWDQRSNASEVTLTLPLTDLPAVPIIDLHIKVANNYVYRLPMDDSARIQTAHIRNLAEQAGLTFDPALTDLITALFYYPSKNYGELWKSHHEPPRSWLKKLKKIATDPDPTYEYLKSRFDGNKCMPHFSRRVYNEWKMNSESISELVENFALIDHLSATGSPLIALPHYFDELQKAGPLTPSTKGANVTELLGKLHSFLCGAKSAADDERPCVAEQAEAAKRLLYTYSSYGLQWTVFAKCTVPKDKPFTITIKEKRPVYFAPYRDGGPSTYLQNKVWKMVSFGDAKTNHISIHTEDNAVRLGAHYQVTDQKLEQIQTPADEEQSTPELYLRHDSTEPRTSHIFIGIPLKLTRLTSCWLWLTIIVAGYGIILLLLRGMAEYDEAGNNSYGVFRHGLSAGDAAIFLIPVAFAASFLLTKDTSTLNSRLRRKRQAFLLGEIAVLLIMAFAFFTVHHIKTVDSPPKPTKTAPRRVPDTPGVHGSVRPRPDSLGERVGG